MSSPIKRLQSTSSIIPWILKVRWPLFIFLFALVLRLIFILTLESKYYWPDEIYYDSLARRVVSGEGYGSWVARGPLYAFFLAGIYQIIHPGFLVVRFLQAFLDSGSALLLLYLGSWFFNKKTGFIAGILYAIYPYFIYLSGMLASEPLYLFLTFLSLTFYVFFRKTNQRRYLALFGVGLGLSALCRPVALIYIFPFMLWIGFISFPKRSIVKNSAIFILFVFLPILPWTARNYVVHGDFLLISAGSGLNLYLGNGPDPVFKADRVPDEINNIMLTIPFDDPPSLEPFYTEEARQFRRERPNLPNVVDFSIERDALLREKALSYILANPLNFLRNYLKKLFLFWSPMKETMSKNEFTTLTTDIVGIVSFLGIFIPFLFGVLFSVRDWRKLCPLYFMIFAMNLGIALLTTTVRYRIVVDPYLILFAAFGIETGWVWFLQRRTAVVKKKLIVI